MRRTILPISALLAATLVMYFSAGQQGILVPVRAGLEGFSTLTVGFFGTAYAVGFVAGCYLVPWLLRRVGHIRTFSVMASLAATGILLKGVMVHPEVWLVLRMVAGMSIAGAAIIIESWLNARSTNENRGTVFATYMVVYLGAVTGGQMSLMLFDPATVTMFVVSGVLLSLALVPTALTLMPAPEPPERAELHLKALYALSPVGAVGALVIGLANGAFGTLGPIYAQETGFDTTGIAIFMSVALLAGAIAQWPLGRLSDLMDRRIVIASVSFVGMAAGVLLVLFLAPGPPAYLLITVFGVAAYSLYGLTVAHANDHADPSQFVAVSGGLLLMFGIGSALGPMAAAGLSELVTSRGLFMFTAAAHLALAAFVVYRIGQRPAVPAAQKDDFVGFARPTSPGAATLDPRFDEEAPVPEVPAGEAMSYVAAEPGDDTPGGPSDGPGPERD
mgnify:CR=1 FL=1